MMIISESNGEVINSQSVYLHDAILDKLTFDRLKKEMYITFDNSKMNRDISNMKFVNTIGFEMTSCDYWGESPHIFDFEYVEKDMRKLLPRLYNMQEYDLCSSLCKLTLDKDFMEVIITFTSGDILTIVCEYIIIS